MIPWVFISGFLSLNHELNFEKFSFKSWIEFELSLLRFFAKVFPADEKNEKSLSDSTEVEEMLNIYKLV